MAANPNPDRIADDRPAPDPGNAPPEDWTEDLDPAEVQDIAERLERETS